MIHDDISVKNGEVICSGICRLLFEAVPSVGAVRRSQELGILSGKTSTSLEYYMSLDLVVKCHMISTKSISIKSSKKYNETGSKGLISI